MWHTENQIKSDPPKSSTEIRTWKELIFQNRVLVNFAKEMHICKLNVHSYKTLIATFAKAALCIRTGEEACICFSFRSRWGFCYLKKAVYSLSLFSRTEGSCPWSFLSNLSSQATPDFLRNSTDRSLSWETQGELHFLDTAYLLQLGSDFLARGNNQHKPFEIAFSYKANKQMNKQVKVMNLQVHLFGNRKEIYSELEKTNMLANAKEEEAMNLELKSISSCSCVLHPPTT